MYIHIKVRVSVIRARVKFKPRDEAIEGWGGLKWMVGVCLKWMIGVYLKWMLGCILSGWLGCISGGARVGFRPDAAIMVRLIGLQLRVAIWAASRVTEPP